MREWDTSHVKVVAALVLPALIVLVLAYGVMRLAPYPSPPSQKHAVGVVWAGRTFVNRAEFARWLRSRGVKYSVWAQRHPELSGIKPKPQVERSARPVTKENGSGRRFDWLLPSLAAAAGLIVLCLVLVLRRRGALRLGGLRWARRRRGPPVRAAAPQAEAGASPAARRSDATRPRQHRPIGLFTRLRAAALLDPRRRPLRARKQPHAERPRATARLAATATSVRARLTQGWAAAMTALGSASARPDRFVAGHRRDELAWALAVVVISAGTGVLVTVWFGRA